MSKSYLGIQRIVWVCGGVLLLASAVTLYYAIATNWPSGDWIALSFGIIIAAAQVLAVYAWIEPKLDKLKEVRREQTWENATREFMATCIMSSRDITNSLSRQLGRAQNGAEGDRGDNAPVLLRTGITDALANLANKSAAFDMTIRLCSNGFSDQDLAELSLISSELRSAADNACDARERLDRVCDAIQPFDAIDRARMVDKALPADRSDPFDWHASWFVHNLLRVIEDVADAGRELEAFVFKPRPTQTRSERDLEHHLGQSKRYQKANEIRLDPEELTIERHRTELSDALARLDGFKATIEAHGVCMAWESENQPITTTRAA